MGTIRKVISSSSKEDVTNSILSGKKQHFLSACVGSFRWVGGSS